jgi:hypothetical protein
MNYHLKYIPFGEICKPLEEEVIKKKGIDEILYSRRGYIL